tara:strand:+ start:4620 stop:4883 length:264 start_codon:yes stop_codon:yes gene_type:complete
MLQGILVKKVLDLVLKQIFKKFDLNKINKYVEEDNELDIQMKQAIKTISKQGKYIEELEKKVAMLEKDSHPPIKNLEKRIKKLEKEK